NNTLMFIIKLLNDNNIKNWFIGYGTLLGIIRDDTCINGDDDIDIIIDHSNYDVVKKILIENNIKLEYGFGIGDKTNILKTKENDNYCTVDFYMASLDEKGNFHDTWEKVIWSECYNEKNELIQYMWNPTAIPSLEPTAILLYLPFNYEKKLINRYGEKWRIPQNNKGPMPHKKIL
ncbi:LicD family protein, partial [bacterium]|nr:LicD family protein [bacterium]